MADKKIDPGADDQAPLTADEISAAKAKARKTVLSKRRARQLAAIEAEETRRLEREEGLTTGDQVKDEIVSILIDLYPGSDRLTLNGMVYFHGQTYKVPRHVADSMREMIARGHNHERLRLGQKLMESYQNPRNTMITKVGVVNPPQRAA